MCMAVAEDEQANHMIQYENKSLDQLSYILTSIHYQGGSTQVKSE